MTLEDPDRRVRRRMAGYIDDGAGVVFVLALVSGLAGILFIDFALNASLLLFVWAGLLVLVARVIRR